MSRFCIFLLFIIVVASPGYALTVEEAVDYALKNNPEIQALRLEEDIAKGFREKAGLLFSSNPVLEGSVSKKERPSEEGGGNFTNYGISLSQEIEIAGQRVSRISAADEEISRVSFEIKDSERLLASDVKDTYARATAAKMRENLSREVVRLQEELVGFTKIKFQAGDASGLDVNLSEVELSKAKKELLSAEREGLEALLTLKGILGMKSDSALNIEGELPSEAPLIAGKERLRDLMLMRRSDMKASYFEVEKTKSALALVKKEAVPNLTIAGFYTRDEEKNEVGLALSLPLPFFDRKQAEKAEALARANQAGIKSEGLKKTAVKEFEQAYVDLLSATEELSLFKREIMAKATENMGLLNLAYKEGKIGFFEVRLAQKETFDTQFDYLDTQLKAKLSLNALEKAIGGPLK